VTDRVVHFASLLSTDRAVKRRGAWVRVHLAGRQSTPWWVEFHRTLDARRAAGSLLVHLREKRARGEIQSDGAYNQIIVDWIDQLGGLGYIKSKEKHDDRIEKSEETEASAEPPTSTPPASVDR
jgi:hypothetical protein